MTSTNVGDYEIWRYFKQVGPDLEATREQLTAAVERKRAESPACAIPPNKRRRRPLSGFHE